MFMTNICLLVFFHKTELKHLEKVKGQSLLPYIATSARSSWIDSFVCNLKNLVNPKPDI